MLLQVQLTLLQKNFEGGALAPLAPPLDPPLAVIGGETSLPKFSKNLMLRHETLITNNSPSKFASSINLLAT